MIDFRAVWQAALAGIWQWLTYALGAVALVLLILYLRQGIVLERKQTEVTALQGDLKQAKTTLQNFQDAARRCSASVGVMEAEAKIRQAEAAKSLATLRAERDRYKASGKRLAALQAAPTPSGAGCKEAVAAARKELK